MLCLFENQPRTKRERESSGPELRAAFVDRWVCRDPRTRLEVWMCGMVSSVGEEDHLESKE